jgi:hypothetical protein
MFTKNAKRYLMLLAALGLIAIAAGSSGTFAGFNAEVTNSGNYFKTGTLFLHDTANGITCTSESASDNNNNGTGDTCGTIFTVNTGDAGATAETSYGVDLVNAGTIASTAVQFYGTCTPSIGGYVTSGLTFATTGQGAAVTSIHTTGTLNYALPIGTKIKIGSTIYTTTTSVVAYGAVNPTIAISSADTSSFAGGEALNVGIQFGGGHNLCQGIKAEIGTVSASGEDYTDGSYTCKWGCGGANTLDDLNSLNSNSLATLAGTTMAASATQHLIVTLTPPSFASPDNTYQNQRADVSLTWHIDQA